MTKLEKMNESLEALSTQVDETLLALDDIKKSVEDSGIEVGNAPLTEYADKVSALYDKGVNDEYERFWSTIIPSKGSIYIFAGNAWNNTTFNPNKNLSITGNAMGAFYANGYSGDLAALCDSKNILLRFSDCTNLDNGFAYCKFTRVGIIDLSNVTSAGGLFLYATKLSTIDKIILKSTTPIYRWFDNCTALINLTIEGEIGRNGLNLSWSTLLSKNSILSVVNALSSTTTGLTITLSLTAVNNAFGGNTSQEWLDLVATKSNWTISLVDA